MGKIDWNALTHAYGPATDTPEYLHQLHASNPTERRAAREALTNTLGHQGSRYTATAAAIPLLCENLLDPQIQDKAELIQLLVYFAIGYPESYLPLGIDPLIAFAEADAVSREEAGPELYDDYEPEVARFWERDCYQAVESRLAQIATFVNDSQREVRIAAVSALAWFPMKARESLQLVRNVVHTTTDSGELANAILALGILARALDDTSDEQFLWKLTETTNAPIVRISVAISLGVILGTTICDQGVQLLLESIELANQFKGEWGLESWHCSGWTGHACVTFTLIDPAPSEAIVSTLCKAIESASWHPLLNLTYTLFSVVFPDKESVSSIPDPSLPSGQRLVYRAGRDLTAHQRRALEAVCHNPYWETKSGFGPLEEVLWEFGIPAELAKIQQILSDKS